MYLVTKLFVEDLNPVRELAKYFSNPGVEHWKAVEKLTGYLKDNEDDINLTYRKPRELWIVSSIDNNYATDKEGIRSTSYYEWNANKLVVRDSSEYYVFKHTERVSIDGAGTTGNPFYADVVERNHLWCRSRSHSRGQHRSKCSRQKPTIRSDTIFFVNIIRRKTLI
jgi:hypothetical protein